MSKRLVVASCVVVLFLACAVTRHEVVTDHAAGPAAPASPGTRGASDFVLSAPLVPADPPLLGITLASPAATVRSDSSCSSDCHAPIALASGGPAGEPGAEFEDESEGEAAERRGRDELAFYQRSYPATGLPDGALEVGRTHFAAQRALMTPSAVAALPAWSPVGPSPIIGERHGAESLRQNCSGRATAVLVDPRNSNTVYIGAAQGGVWKTTNAGASWAPLTATAPSQATGFMTFDPTNPDIVYVGTGEPHGSDSHYGAGLLKSTNGGASWTVLGADVFSGRAISAVVVNPQNTQQLWVGVSTRVGGYVDVKPNLAKPGVYRSSDGGASWPDNQAIRLCSQSNPENCINVSSVSMDRGNPNVVYVGFDGYGVYKTTDGGASWSAILGPAAAQTGGWDQSLGDAARVEVIVAPSDSRVVYAGFHTIRQQGVPGVLFRSVDSGQNWTPLNVQPAGYPEAVSYCGGQCSYDNVLAVHPTDPNVLAAGGAALYSNGLWDGTIFITRDGGTSFSTHTGTALDQTAHPDLHGITFDPSNPNTIWITNDGGVYRSTNGGNSWTERNGNLSTLQFQSIAQHPTDPNVMFGGMQDNAKAKTTDGGATWVGLDAGDGGFAAIDPFDTRYWFGTRFSMKGGPMQFQRNDLSGSASADDWPVKIIDAGSGVDVNDNVLFYAPLVLDPSVAGRAYWATARLYRTDNRGDSFTAISPDLTKAASRFSAISAVSVRKGDSSTIVVGTGDGKVQVTRNGGGSWTDITKAPLPNRFVTDVFAYDSSVYYAAFSGFGANTPGTTGHVFKTTDGGASWSDVSRTGQAGGLPDLPVSALAVDRNEVGVLYAGTDLGVYRTLNDGATWEPFSEGMPLLAIYDLDLTRFPDGTRRLAAATHGRSIYRVVVTGDGGGGGDVTAPTTPTGPATGSVATSYSYTTGGSTCTSGGGAEYQFDWGDGTSSAWLTPAPLSPGGPDEAVAVPGEAAGGADSGAAWSAAGTTAAGALAPASGAPIESVAPGSEPPFSYYYQGRLVVLEPSAELVAVREETGGRDLARRGTGGAEGWCATRASAKRRAGAAVAWSCIASPSAARSRTPPPRRQPTAHRAGAGAGPGLAGAAGLRAGRRDEDRVGRGDRRLPRPDGPRRSTALRRRHAGGAGPARRAAAVRRPVRRADRVRRGRPGLRRRARTGAAPELAFAEPNHVLILHGDAAVRALRLEGVAAPPAAGRSRPMGGVPPLGAPATAPAADPFAAPGWTTILADNFEGSARSRGTVESDGDRWVYPGYSTARARQRLAARPT